MVTNDLCPGINRIIIGTLHRFALPSGTDSGTESG